MVSTRHHRQAYSLRSPLALILRQADAFYDDGRDAIATAIFSLRLRMETCWKVSYWMASYDLEWKRADEWVVYVTEPKSMRYVVSRQGESAACRVTAHA